MINKYLILTFLLITLTGCSTISEYPWEVERRVLVGTPYLVDVFDCKGRADMASAYLKLEGYETEVVLQTDYKKRAHVCVYWEKNNQSGTILCDDTLNFVKTGTTKL